MATERKGISISTSVFNPYPWASKPPPIELIKLCQLFTKFWKADDLQKFIDRAKRITRLTELTPEIVHEFIDKIVVSKPETVNGKRHQRVDVYYSTIGLWYAPPPEEMEKSFQEHLAYQRKRTA